MNEQNDQNPAQKGYAYPEIFLELPLYTEINYGGEDQIYDRHNSLKYPEFTLDCFCVHCKSESVFRPIKNKRDLTYYETIERGTHITRFLCSRDAKHQLIFIFYFSENVFQKIGQNPSIADLQKPDIQKYHKILGDEKFKEFSRAVGLVAHGVGIGSFVYLRRIFESLIEEAHQIASKQKGWDEDEYSMCRVEEQIEKLKDYLPEFLVKNRKIYSILSKGIHELSEEECLTHFEALKVGIEIILDQKLEEKKREEKIKRAEISIQSVHNSLKTET